MAWKVRIADLGLAQAERLAEEIEAIAGADLQATAIDSADEKRGLWRLEAYCAEGCEPAAFAAKVRAAAAFLGFVNVDPQLLKVADEDWVARAQKGLAPVVAGRFFIHGSHDRAERPANAIAVEIDAAQAFGTGHHASTLGCLKAFDALVKRRRPNRILDLGCGSGILAIAAALACRTPVVAADIDPVAVRIAHENARINGAARYMSTVQASGTRHRAIRKAAPYELVFANILARPLRSLAPQIALVLAPHGRAILSGLTPAQEAGVVGAYRIAGLRLERRLRADGWSVLIVTKCCSSARARARPPSGCRSAPGRYLSATGHRGFPGAARRREDASSASAKQPT